jgi:citrate synthase
MLSGMATTDQQWLTSRAASARLGVKLATLYAYASRGLITSLASNKQRGRLYASDDVERLLTRHTARSGHGPVAASALRFGEPVLETRISDVDPGGPRYRGRSALDLCHAGVGFERVAELLWTGELPSETEPAAPRAVLRCDAKRLWPLLKGGAALPKMSLIVGALALADDDRHAASDAAEHARARGVLRWLAQAPAAGTPRDLGSKKPIALSLLEALSAPSTPARITATDCALVLCAEHELNASAFAARVAASTGADLYACLAAALSTLSGSAHGGMCDRVEALIDAIGKPERAARTVREWLSRGQQIPGFGHPLYPKGDPRGAYLVELAQAQRAKSESARTAFALLAAMARGGHPAPTLDAGLVTLCHCLDLPRGSAATIFALGRTAGWVAHALEQRAAGYVLRPRARYVGVPPLP